MCIICVFGYSQRVDNATPTIVLGTTRVCLRVRKNNLCATRVHTPAHTGTLAVKIIPPANHFNGKLVLVLIVGTGIGITIQRAVAMLMIWIAPIVPILAQPLVATVFGLNHRVMLALVNIKHFTAILRLAYVKHFARTYGASAVGIVFVADVAHFNHMVAAD